MDSVSICNYSLLMLGIPAISSFDESNNNARLCRAFYPVLRDRVLRDHTWSFATAFRSLSLLSEDGIPGYAFSYALPADIIRVIGLSEGGDYKRIGDRIYSNEMNPVLEYVRQVSDPNEFDDAFTEALQYLLAAELGMSFTKDHQLIQMYRNEYRERLAVARSIDSQENQCCNQPSARRSKWIESRRRGV